MHLFVCVSVAVFAPQSSAIERKGCVIGTGVISIAGSHSETSFDEPQFGISLPNLKFGWMVSDRLVVMATFPGMIYEYWGQLILNFFAF